MPQKKKATAGAGAASDKPAAEKVVQGVGLAGRKSRSKTIDEPWRRNPTAQPHQRWLEISVSINDRFDLLDEQASKDGWSDDETNRQKDLVRAWYLTEAMDALRAAEKELDRVLTKPSKSDFSNEVCKRILHLRVYAKMDGERLTKKDAAIKALKSMGLSEQVAEDRADSTVRSYLNWCQSKSNPGPEVEPENGTP